MQNFAQNLVAEFHVAIVPILSPQIVEVPRASNLDFFWKTILLHQLRLWAKKHALVNRKALRGPKLARLPVGPLIGPNIVSW